MTLKKPFFFKWLVVVLGLVIVFCWMFLSDPPEPSDLFDFKSPKHTFWGVAIFTSPLRYYPSLMVKDTVWKEGSTHHVNSKLFIARDVTLTIEPGVKVLINAGVKITSAGHIVAKGRKEAPIVFACRNEDKNWLAVECVSDPIDSSSAPVQIFKYCEFRDGGELTIKGGRAEIEHSTFHDNTAASIRIENSSGRISHNTIFRNVTNKEESSSNGAGIMVYTNKEVLVSDNNVYENRSLGGRDGGGGIYAVSYDQGKVTIRENIIRNNYSDRNGSGLIAYSCLVENNTITGNHAEMMGGGLYTISSRVLLNQITDNHAQKGGGIYAEYAHHIAQNLVCRNSAPQAFGAGLYFLGDGKIENNTFAQNFDKTSEKSDAIMISGSAVLSQNNIIAHPGGYALRIDSPGLSPDVDAKGNFWGSNDTRTIEAMVYDWLDDSAVGMVTWDNYASHWLEDTPKIPDGVIPKTRILNDIQKPLELNGMIYKNLTIGGSSGTQYRVTGNVLIRKGVTLTILPGTTLNFSPGISMRVRGRLIAQGNQSQPVVLTGDPDSKWGPLLIENRSIMNDMTEDNRPPLNCELSFCRIENGKGIQMEEAYGRVSDCTLRNHSNSAIMIRNAAVAIYGNQIIDNYGGQNGGGINVCSTLPVDIEENVIKGNKTSGDGGGIFAYGYHAGIAINISSNQIVGNRSEGQGGGIWATRSLLVSNQIQHNQAGENGGGVFSCFAQVMDNHIENNTGSMGGGIYAETSSTVENNRIIANQANNGLGGGVYLNFWGMGNKNDDFKQNRIVENRATGTGGIYLIGAMNFDRNAICENQGYQLKNGNHLAAGEFDALYCYWGVITREQIESSIYDGLDDPVLSRVNFEPFMKHEKE